MEITSYGHILKILAGILVYQKPFRNSNMVFWAKDPALGPARSFSAKGEKNEIRQSKKKKKKKKESNKISEGNNLLPLKPHHDDNGVDIEGAKAL